MSDLDPKSAEFRRAVRRLPPDYREVVELAVAGLSLREIARRLQISSRTASFRLEDAVALLRGYMSD